MKKLFNKIPVSKLKVFPLLIAVTMAIVEEISSQKEDNRLEALEHRVKQLEKGDN